MDNKSPILQIQEGESKMKVLSFFRAVLLMVTVMAGLSLDSVSLKPALVFVVGGVVWLMLTAFAQSKEAVEK
jgi:hypothetical protein